MGTFTAEGQWATTDYSGTNNVLEFSVPFMSGIRYNAFILQFFGAVQTISATVEKLIGTKWITATVAAVVPADGYGTLKYKSLDLYQSLRMSFSTASVGTISVVVKPVKVSEADLF